ncbi:hypothetical protein [Kitasatospora cheerisanensis]|uniref:hypothetical protein n=1 Tax=Kitasatospora cheerisanensis TaxID=81942 RepID=UPI0012ECC94C|nr:hypothetical protein [Kitasatospora cheerisanensis]
MSSWMLLRRLPTVVPIAMPVVSQEASVVPGLAPSSCLSRVLAARPRAVLRSRFLVPFRGT